MRFYNSIVLAAIIAVVFAAAVEAQTRKKTLTTTKKPAASAIAPAPVPEKLVEPAVVRSEPKKNERPSTTSSSVPVNSAPAKTDATYFYEFKQPEFTISRIVIEHDDGGRGTITFTRKMFSETATDPLQISAAALARINAAFGALNFVDANENYQYEKDYSHLGTMTFRLKRGDRQRTATFNYTVNKDAKNLADEYRRVGNQFIWVFDITVARENQPLEAPRLVDSLDTLIRRNEISDPEQMVPLLKSLSNDERVPLIARNHADRLVKQIEKGKK